MRRIDRVPLVKDYLDHLRLPKNTLDSYKSALEKFYSWVDINTSQQAEAINFLKFHNFLDHGNKVGSAPFSSFDAGLYIAWLKDQNYSPATLPKMITPVRRYFEWMVHTERLAENPFSGIRIPKPALHYKDIPFSVEEVKLLLEAAIRSTYPKMMVALVQMFVVTGLRVTEVCNLQIDDIGDLVIVRNGKGHRFGMSAATIGLKEALAEYISRERHEPISEPWLFLSPAGTKLNPTTIRTLLATVSKEAGIRKAKPHLLRKTAASMLASAKMPIRYIQLQLRHRRVETTPYYAQYQVEVLRDAVNSLNLLSVIQQLR